MDCVLSYTHDKNYTEREASTRMIRRASTIGSMAKIGGQRGSLFSDYMLPMTKTINDPIQCGYFLAFCEQEHSLENLLFVMDVDRFRDYMKIDKKCWQGKWIDTDAQVFQNFVTSETVDVADLGSFKSGWPSKVLQRREIERKMKELWDSYLSDSAPHQICISHNMRARTKIRMELVHLYGPAVFNEALYDPLATLRNDTLPRFKTSVLYSVMTAMIHFCCKLPAADTLDLPPPRVACSPFRGASLESLPDSRLFDINEILRDSFLYGEFLNHLQEVFSCENLLCIRKIKQFDELIALPYTPSGGRTCSEDAEMCAWEIYRYFVATGACYEITLSVRQRKDVMISLAKPERKMFEVLYDTTMGHLIYNFNSYKFTDSYLNSCRRLREDKMLRKIKAVGTGRKNGFFGRCLFWILSEQKKQKKMEKLEMKKLEMKK